MEFFESGFFHLSIMYLLFIHVTACISSLPPFLANIPLCECIVICLAIYLSIHQFTIMWVFSNF